MPYLSEDEVHGLLHGVDQKEAEADEKLGQTLELNLLRGLSESLPGLGKDVEHGDGQHDPAPEAEEHRGDHLTRAGLYPLHPEISPTRED